MFIAIHVRYLKGALVPDSDSAQDALEAPTGHRRDYIPTGAPGSRLPHMNVRLLSNLTSEVCPSSTSLFFFLVIYSILFYQRSKSPISQEIEFLRFARLAII